MTTTTATAPRVTSVFVNPESPAGSHYRKGREHAALAPGFAPQRALNLHDYGGKKIEKLTFTNVYLGGRDAWDEDDIGNIDRALAAAMSDKHLQHVIAQYYPDGKPTSTFKPSRILEQPCPKRVYRNTIETLVASLESENGLSGFDLANSVFCFMLPRGVVLVDGDSRGHAKRRRDEDEEGGSAVEHERDEQTDSKHGLGGYHGSIHPKHGSRTGVVYYAVGVYSEGSNGIVAFDEPWKSVCATFYHELNEARTDPDVEDAIRAGDTPRADAFLGWYSPRGGEIGDIPMEEAGADLSTVMKEIPLANGRGTVPVQLMWSNRDGGPAAA
jgi:hypothetical protein